MGMMVLMAAAALVVMIVMLMAAAAFVVMIVVVMTAAAFMVMIVMLMAAAALVVMVVMMAAAAFMVMVMMIMAAATCMIMLMVMMAVCIAGSGRLPAVSGADHSTALHSPGNSDQFRDQCIRIFRCQPQLLGGKGNDCLLHRFMIVELFLDLCGAVGTVQILNDVYFSGHPDSSRCFNI